MPTITIRPGDVGRLVWSWAVGALALFLTAELLPHLSADSWTDWLPAAIVTGVVGALLRPLLVWAAALIGWIAVVGLALVGQALILHVSLSLVPGIHCDSFWTLVAASWIAATIATAFEWLSTAGTPDSLVAMLARDVRPRRHSAPLRDPEVTGMVFIQLDGVPFPLLRWAL